MLLAESKRMLQWIVDAFNRVYKRRRLKVNAGESKVMVLRKLESRLLTLRSHTVRPETRCKIWLGEEMMEEVSAFKNSGTVLCKQRSMEGDIRERAGKAGNRCSRESYGREKCECRGKEGHKKSWHRSAPAIYIRYIDFECCTANRNINGGY